jgi:putative transposase
MPNYRRSFVGNTYFFTVVTFNRLPILTSEPARSILRRAWLDVRKRYPFKIEAVCLLPEHLHCVWVLPEDDQDYSVRWKEIKRLFTHGYIKAVGPGEARNASRQKRGEAAIWQRRFWEHTIRDAADLNRHIDYIHYNPVKHRLCERVSDWPWSSFHHYVRMGQYAPDWGLGDEGTTLEIGE